MPMWKHHRSEERRVGKEWRMGVRGEQAEDGIRDTSVTGVQTCALPIFVWPLKNSTLPIDPSLSVALAVIATDDPAVKLELVAGLVIPTRGAVFGLPMTTATDADVETP